MRSIQQLQATRCHKVCQKHTRRCVLLQHLITSFQKYQASLMNYANPVVCGNDEIEQSIRVRKRDPCGQASARINK